MFWLALRPTVAIYLLASADLVLGHGYIRSMVNGGKTYTGWDPDSDPYQNPPPARIFRQTPGDQGPIAPQDMAFVACYKMGKTPAQLVADVAAGSSMTFQWTPWLADHKGPTSTRMASCNGDCRQFDPTNAQYFTLDAAGIENGIWASERLIQAGSVSTSTIPADLASGQYIVRSEIVALHSNGQPQIYPNCAQVNVQGSGTWRPSQSDLITMPDLYKEVKFPYSIYTSDVQFTWAGPPPVHGTQSGSTSVMTSSRPTPTTGTNAPTRPSNTTYPAMDTPSDMPKGFGRQNGRCRAVLGAQGYA